MSGTMNGTPDLSRIDAGTKLAAEFTLFKRQVDAIVNEEQRDEWLKGWSELQGPAPNSRGPVPNLGRLPPEEPEAETDPLLLRLDRLEAHLVRLTEMFASVMVLLAKPQEQPQPRSVRKVVHRDEQGRIESVEEVEEPNRML